MAHADLAEVAIGGVLTVPPCRDPSGCYLQWPVYSCYVVSLLAHAEDAFPQTYPELPAARSHDIALPEYSSPDLMAISLSTMRIVVLVWLWRLSLSLSLSLLPDFVVPREVAIQGAVTPAP